MFSCCRGRWIVPLFFFQCAQIILGCRKLQIQTNDISKDTWELVSAQQWGWQASLSWKIPYMRSGNKSVIRTYPNRFCMAVLINEEFVLTQAYCVTFSFDGKIIPAIAKQVLVSLGGRYQFVDYKSTTNIVAKDIYIHPDFIDSQSRSHAVALIRLSSKVAFTKSIQPACLPFSDSDVDLGGNHKGIIVTFHSPKRWVLFLVTSSHYFSLSTTVISKC